MQIETMIALHPDVGGDPNQPLAAAADQAMACAAACISCADACTAEQMDMRQCIRSCLDCADVCAATGRLAVRRTGHNGEALRAMLETCADICELCAGECARHSHEHCRLCAQTCRECARACRAAVPAGQ
jgi:hypothetical protein